MLSSPLDLSLRHHLLFLVHEYHCTPLRSKLQAVHFQKRFLGFMAGETDGIKFEQRHGKTRVRVGRVWKRSDGSHSFVEWSVSVSLLSDCLPAYFNGDNSHIVATDTMKNTVYIFPLLPLSISMCCVCSEFCLITWLCSWRHVCLIVKSWELSYLLVIANIGFG